MFPTYAETKRGTSTSEAKKGERVVVIVVCRVCVCEKRRKKRVAVESMARSEMTQYEAVHPSPVQASRKRTRRETDKRQRPESERRCPIPSGSAKNGTGVFFGPSSPEMLLNDMLCPANSLVRQKNGFPNPLYFLFVFRQPTSKQTPQFPSRSPCGRREQATRPGR
jgi:hypothetical protein